MTESRSIVGPRGLAVLTLVGGASLALPFMRRPNAPELSRSSVAASQHVVAPSGLLEGAGGSFEASPVAGALVSRRVDLPPPNTDAIARRLLEEARANHVDLPPWAKRVSNIDQIISAGVAESLPPPQLNESSGLVAIPSMPTWVEPQTLVEHPLEQTMERLGTGQDRDRRSVSTMVPSLLGGETMPPLPEQANQPKSRTVSSIRATGDIQSERTSQSFDSGMHRQQPPRQKHFVYQPSIKPR